MKISIIGAGNVGGLSAMRLLEENLGEIVLVDAAKGLAQGKALDLEDAAAILKFNYKIKGSDDIGEIKGSDIVVISAGFSRKPGMAREDLLQKNSEVVRSLCADIKKLAPLSIIIVVTNPLDLLTYLALKITGFKPNKVFGMGVTLDAGRFAGLIAKELNLSAVDIEACVIGSHGEGMLPLARLTRVKGIGLDEIIAEEKIAALATKTMERGKEIVSLLGSASAYFAPSAAVAEIVRVIAKDEKRTLGICAYLNGEYGIKDVCIGVPCRLGKEGIEKIVELDLNKVEKQALTACALKLKEQIKDNGL